MFRILSLVLLSVSLCCSTARATSTLTASERIAALHAIEKTIQTTYVFPELRTPIIARLEHAEQTQRYDVNDPALFAQRVTEDLQAVSNDGHLYLDSDKNEYNAATAPARAVSGMNAYRRDEAIRDHSGIVKMEVLPGNVRYLKVSGFEWTPGTTAAAYDDAIRFLKDGDAIIIDLRQNGGGESDAASYLLSAFFDPGTLLYVHHDVASDVQSRTVDSALAGYLKGKPLFVVVDGRTGSAAEAVTYAFQQERVGKIVGSTTYGAANNNKTFPIAPQFILSVSYGRPISPVSGTNWEGVGVKPDILAPGNAALAAAQVAALDWLSATPNVRPKMLDEYRWARIAAEARLHPVSLARNRLQAFAGNYGPIEVHSTAEGLRVYRPTSSHWPQGVLLTPLTSAGLFGVEGLDLRVRFTGSTLELLFGSEDDHNIYPRNDSGAKAVPKA